MLEKEASSEGSKIIIEPRNKVQTTELKVPVIYYLSRNGQLEHPHLMEVSISSPQEVLCLKDVIDRLSFLRGQEMVNMYSWSTKRSYKNGFVWQDLSENDLIYPSSGHEYVLKGTQMMEASASLRFRSCETISTSSSFKSSTSANNCSTCEDSPATMKGRRSQSLNSCDYKLYKAKTCEEFAGKGTNAWTQTEEKRRERIVEECEGNDARKLELSENNEGSLRFSSSSFGALEGSLESYGSADIRSQRVENERSSGRIKASEVLMQFIRCG
ncbi:hypothetical protein Fmac_022968 [Flemingia macrophylla]|uniref:SOSEKI DIX-like domain-containing protein n=1 Tax=Flemingia macrophylla TaxID=520843 RepID=A0ABD1LK65_9FABA